MERASEGVLFPVILCCLIPVLVFEHCPGRFRTLRISVSEAEVCRLFPFKNTLIDGFAKYIKGGPTSYDASRILHRRESYGPTSPVNRGPGTNSVPSFSSGAGRRGRLFLEGIDSYVNGGPDGNIMGRGLPRIFERDFDLRCQLKLNTLAVSTITYARNCRSDALRPSPIRIMMLITKAILASGMTRVIVSIKISKTLAYNRTERVLTTFFVRFA